MKSNSQFGKMMIFFAFLCSLKRCSDFLKPPLLFLGIGFGVYEQIKLQLGLYYCSKLGYHPYNLMNSSKHSRKIHTVCLLFLFMKVEFINLDGFNLPPHRVSFLHHKL